MNVNGRTPEQSEIPVGTITIVPKKQGNGKISKTYRVQYHTMYFTYSSMNQAIAKRDKWLENGENK